MLNETNNLFSNHLKIPTHTTILNWIHKIGLYQLQKCKNKANDWIIILDHSIQFGKEKVFVILGIRKKDVDFSRPLQFQDLTPLREISDSEWTGEKIKNILLGLKNEIGNIIYAIADQGSNIKNGLELAKIKHIRDITHMIAIILKRIYSKNETFIELTKMMNLTRISLRQTELGHLIPPKQREKSRFENIKSISDWGIKIINYLKTIDIIKDIKLQEKIKQKLTWIVKYKKIIYELYEINQAISKVQEIIKNNGLSKKTYKESLNVLQKLTFNNGKIIKEKIEEYFKETFILINDNKTLCSSDIIESAFGKYKNYVSSNPMAGITNLILCIAAFTSDLNTEEVKKCMETTTINDVKSWSKEFIGKTLFQKRKECLGVT